MTSPVNMEWLHIVRVPAEEEGWLLRLEGVLDMATAGSLRDQLREIERSPVVLDLSGLEFTDSTGLATLLEGRRRTECHGVALRIRGARGQTRELLERTRVMERFGDPASSTG